MSKHEQFIEITKNIQSSAKKKIKKLTYNNNNKISR